MSAELLQRAAAALREHAEKAQKERPWCPEYTWSAVRHVQRNVEIDCATHDDRGDCWSFDMYDGRYVALMHPPVALALAACMEQVAWMGEMDADLLARVGVPELIDVARATLREPS